MLKPSKTTLSSLKSLSSESRSQNSSLESLVLSSVNQQQAPFWLLREETSLISTWFSLYKHKITSQDLDQEDGTRLAAFVIPDEDEPEPSFLTQSYPPIKSREKNNRLFSSYQSI